MRINLSFIPRPKPTFAFNAELLNIIASTAVYVLKCQELGVIPSTQVVQQLRQADASMAHCKLGRHGAQVV